MPKHCCDQALGWMILCRVSRGPPRQIQRSSWTVGTICELLSHLWGQQKYWLEKVLRGFVLVNSQVSTCCGQPLALSDWLGDLFYKLGVSPWVPGSHLWAPRGHGKKQLRTSTIGWIPIERARNIFLLQLPKSQDKAQPSAKGQLRAVCCTQRDLGLKVRW